MQILPCPICPRKGQLKVGQNVILGPWDISFELHLTVSIRLLCHGPLLFLPASQNCSLRPQLHPCKLLSFLNLLPFDRRPLLPNPPFPHDHGLVGCYLYYRYTTYTGFGTWSV